MPQFLNPGMLWALALLPALALIVAGSYWRRRSMFGRYCPDPTLAAQINKPLTGLRYLLKGVFLCTAVGALIVACARPVKETSEVEFPRGDVDAIAVVDVSRSMAALDYKDRLPEPSKEQRGTRLDMARQLIGTRLMPAMRGNHLGIVSYAGEANPQAPLTDDLVPLNWVLQRALTISSATGEGSAMAKALLLALQLFDADSAPEHQRMIVLFSDGGNDDGEVELGKMADECRRRGISLVVVGLGHTNPAPIPVAELAEDDEVARSLMHHGKLWYEVNGEVEKTALNEATLIWLANKAGGRYIHLTKAGDLEIVSQSRTRTVLKVQGNAELFYYPLVLAVVFAFLLLLVTREFRRNSLLASLAARITRKAGKEQHEN